MTPDKSLGQHWLTDQPTLQAIVDEAALKPDDEVLEIGPGPGALTQQLVQRARHVTAVEFDPRLATTLPKRVPAQNLTVIHGDILHFDLTQLPKEYKVVANLPYYITNKIVRLLLESPNPPQLATLLVQKEVAERMAAPPGAMSILSVATQFYTTVHLGPVVPAALFTPPPQVDSQVITLTRRRAPLFADCDPKLYFRVVRAGFAERRKKLRSSLSGGLHLDKTMVDTLLQRAHVLPDARAQELMLDDWYAIAKELKK